MINKKEIILVTITGEDKPGQTLALTSILAKHNATILDIGQAVIHNNLSLGIVFMAHEDSETSAILKDLLFLSYELGVSAKFKPIPPDDYEHWVQSQGKKRYIVTVVGRQLLAEHIAAVTTIIREQGLNIDHISRLTGRRSINEENLSEHRRACVDLSVRGTPINEDQMKLDFLQMSKKIGIDIAFQFDNAFRRNRKLVCFDMDSTLIQTEVIVELAKYANAEEQVSEITEAAMRGEIDFKESFRQRIALLKGIDENVLHDIARSLPLTEGAHRLISNLKKYGYKTAILSGGFTYFGRYLQTMLGIDYVYANELEIVNGKLTGNYTGEIVDGQMKAELLKKLAFKEDIHLEQVIAVGDGANDLPMISIAGLGIAFHAKPVVQESAGHAISTVGLDSILYLLGFRDREID
jgi:phosphoserine phosphatase